jgi:hypothetical protein
MYGRRHTSLWHEHCTYNGGNMAYLPRSSRGIKHLWDNFTLKRRIDVWVNG